MTWWNKSCWLVWISRLSLRWRLSLTNLASYSCQPVSSSTLIHYSLTYHITPAQLLPWSNLIVFHATLLFLAFQFLHCKRLKWLCRITILEKNLITQRVFLFLSTGTIGSWFEEKESVTFSLMVCMQIILDHFLIEFMESNAVVYSIDTA